VSTGIHPLAGFGATVAVAVEEAGADAEERAAEGDGDGEGENDEEREGTGGDGGTTAETAVGRSARFTVTAPTATTTARPAPMLNATPRLLNDTPDSLCT
jgi:hypothetical protein